MAGRRGRREEGSLEILAIVVRYGTALEDSKTLKGVCPALLADAELARVYRLLIWDNSSEPLPDPALPVPFTYRHSAANLGVSGAFNGALALALERGAAWMLLLDQDSAIDGEFLRRMHAHALALEDDPAYAAIVPTVTVGGVLVSPKEQLFNRNRSYPAGECGTAPGEAIAINSGCLMRPSALHAIGGFSTDFWLDFSDIYVFHQFFAAGKKVWRAADAAFEHDMSIMDYDRLMTPWRYRNFSYAETAFHDLYRGRIENLIQTARLFARAIKQRFKYSNPEFSRIAWEQFLYRMLNRKKARIRNWRATAGYRREGTAAS